MKKGFCLLTCILTISVVMAKDHDNIVSTEISQDRFTLIENGVPTDIFIRKVVICEPPQEVVLLNIHYL